MMNATYSPEDNKLRLYSLHRLDSETYQRVKAAGFKWAPKQELFVAPSWTPRREDLLLELCGEIGDEDYSPEERAADRAERFTNYRDKRRSEAGDHADRFESGPSVFGHQNARRAERQAERHDRQRTNAVSQWSKAEYWQQRTAGVIAHALHKSSASVRRGRILTLEAELRKIVASYTPTHEPPQYSTHKGWNDDEPSLHVWCGPKGRGGNWVRVDSLERMKAGYARWVAHYELRLTYERAMLAEEGGTAAEAEIEVGGWFGGHQVHKVNKSNTTGRVVSIHILRPTHGRDRWGNVDPKAPSHRLEMLNIERFSSDEYRAPTDEERQQFATATKERKAKEKEGKPKAPPLINPTDADAERLQALWNDRSYKQHCERNLENYGKDYADQFKPSTILRVTQAVYSANSKGAYARVKTSDIDADCKVASEHYTTRKTTGPIVFQLRTAYGDGGGYSDKARRVIVITDKPQKPLPLDWEKLFDATAQLAEAS